MARILKELEDLQWFPAEIRRYMTDYLNFLFDRFNLYSPVVSVVREMQVKTGTDSMIDLCSGSGGPWNSIIRQYRKRYREVINVTLTDLYPFNSDTIPEQSFVVYYPESVNALRVPAGLKGIRTMFSGLHHFTLEEVTELLKDASSARQPVAFFDAGNKNILLVLAILVMHPLLLFMFTPFIKPFSFRRLLFTYLLPVVVIGCVWDGVVSIVHLHRKRTLIRLIKNLNNPTYSFKVFTLKNSIGIRILTIKGFPAN